ncbi:unnamed protein product, partial [Mesorhabditis belari]|uniref:Uncharacterized protein n=1 Tax=Mesorhabditis belari TaxID=2138241 RepID=A0AAF3F0M3_9BILA
MDSLPYFLVILQFFGDFFTEAASVKRSDSIGPRSSTTSTTTETPLDLSDHLTKLSIGLICTICLVVGIVIGYCFYDQYRYHSDPTKFPHSASEARLRNEDRKRMLSESFD